MQKTKPINLILSKLILSIKTDTFFMYWGKRLYKIPSNIKTKDIDNNIKLKAFKSRNINNFNYFYSFILLKNLKNSLSGDKTKVVSSLFKARVYAFIDL